MKRFLIVLLLTSCGYTLQTSKSPLFEKHGLKAIYVQPLVNNTYKAGIENVVYNALVRKIASQGTLVLAKSADLADGILSGTVNVAGTAANSQRPAAKLNSLVVPRPDEVIPSEYENIYVTTEYLASIECTFSLTKRGLSRAGQSPLLWSATFSRTKPFPAANQLGVIGTTSALVNESEFDRALSELAQSMMGDVHESMLAMF